MFTKSIFEYHRVGELKSDEPTKRFCSGCGAEVRRSDTAAHVLSRRRLFVQRDLVGTLLKPPLLLVRSQSPSSVCRNKAKTASGHEGGFLLSFSPEE